MKNLIPLIRKKAYWDDIVDKKRPLANRAPLIAIRPAVFNRFKIYINLTTPNTLELIPASTFAAPHTENLRNCYKKSNTLSALKKRIQNRQNIILRAECQYCNIGEPNTFDHYLPQANFPEFSVLSINLLPCCSKCNSKKGDDWVLPNGKRKIINLYYDTLPNISYLNCAITFNGTIPRVKFTIDSNAIPPRLRDTIVSHYSTLNLTERYRQKSNSELTDVMNSIRPLNGRLTRAEIQSMLTADANSMRIDRGTNYWRAVLKTTIANSNTFLTNAGF